MNIEESFLFIVLYNLGLTLRYLSSYEESL